MNKLFYYIAESFRGIWKHKLVSFATICIIAISLVLIGTFSLIYFNIDTEIEELKQRSSFLAYVDESYSENEARNIQSFIETIPNVNKVTFETRDEAMKNFMQYTNEPALSTLPSSILRDRYIINVTNIENIKETVENVEKVDGIANISVSYEVTQGFMDIDNAVTAICTVIIVILLIFSLFMMTNSIKIAASTREKEIKILKMCGVSNCFINTPFYFEGIIIGVLSSIIAYVVQTAVYQEIVNRLNMSQASRIIKFANYSMFNEIVLISFAIIGIWIGIIGTVVSIKKYTKV